MCFRGCLATGCWSLLVIACVTLVTVDYMVQHRNPACDCFSTLLCLSVVSIEDLSLCLLANTHKLLVVRKWTVLHKQEIKVICLQSRSFTFWNVFVITVILKVNVLHLWFVSHFSCFTAAPWLVSVLQTFQCKIQAIVAIYLQPKQMVWDFFPLSLRPHTLQQISGSTFQCVNSFDIKHQILANALLCMKQI